jgi:hypothetical protein
MEGVTVPPTFVRRRAAGAALAGLLAAAGGCSFVGVRRPPPAPPPPDAPLECTQSRVPPAFDVAGAVLTPMLGAMIWGLCEYSNAMQSWSSSPQSLNCSPVLWAAAAGTGAYVGSAIYGFHATGECRRLAAERSPGPAPTDHARPER